MFIWILAIILLGAFAVIGYYQGAVRMAIISAGLLLAALLVKPLTAALRPLMGMVGIADPLLQIIAAAAAGFLLVVIAAIVVAWLVHRKVDLHYKYHSGDVDYLRWGWMNQRIGACVGVLAGAIALLIASVVIYVGGHVAVQVATDDTNSTMIRLLSQGRRDLHETGLDRAAAALSPVPRRYYEAADVLGLIYNNPILIKRLSLYPPFLTLNERSEFESIATDTDYNNLLMTRADAIEIYRHPQTQAIVQAEDLRRQLLDQDLGDLRAFLETGRSPHYADELILGRWKLDLYGTMRQARVKLPNMTASQMAQARKMLEQLAPAITFIATVDQQAHLKVNLDPSIQAAATEAAAQNQPDPEAAQLAQRYGTSGYSGGGGMAGGRGGGGGGAGVRPAPRQPAAAAAPMALMNVSVQGNWERDGNRYILRMTGPDGREERSEAVATDETLTVAAAGTTMVFERIELE
jgi:uncharacterized membrane protein required for colicin V production